jgi:hypothetical protein
MGERRRRIDKVLDPEFLVDEAEIDRRASRDSLVISARE